MDVIRFDDSRRETVDLFLATTEARAYLPALNAASEIIDGFESPLGMEILSTIDWLLREGVDASASAMHEAIANWPGGHDSAQRKLRIFEPRLVMLALDRLSERQTHLKHIANV